MYALMIAMNICSNGHPVSRSTLAELEQRYRPGTAGPMGRFLYHRALWRLSGFETYQYTLSRRCFTMPESDVRVRVEAGNVVAAFNLPESSRPEPLPAEAHSIDEYFELIHRALSTDPDSVHVEYHPLYGYPLSIAIEQTPSVAAERVYQTA